MLESWLEFHRATLLLKCAGLTDDQLKHAACPPSNLTLLGLVRHMAYVERIWFRQRVAGQQVDRLYCTDANPDADFEDLATADAEADFATFGAEVELARQAAAGRSLDDTFVRPGYPQRHPERGPDMGLRWVYVHMIEEYARHNGHADLIRQAIDGATGA
jgi:hypothetical protein